MRVVYLCLQATREGQASHAHVHEIIAGLQRRGVHVTLFEPSYTGDTAVPGPLGRLVEFMRVQVALWLQWRQHRADVLYIRGHFAAYPTAFLARLLGIPMVVEVNGPYEDMFVAWPSTRRFAKFLRAISRAQFRWAAAAIAVTEPLRDWVKSEGARGTLAVIPNGANTELAHPNARTDHKLPSSYVVFFGAFAPWQGIDTLLAAASHPAWPPEVHLVLAGDGAEQAKVEAATRANPLVIYMGRIRYREIPGVVAGSLAGISHQNNLGGRSSTGLAPVKVFETLACGVPVVVSDFPGQSELVRDNACGLVIAPDSPAEVAKAVAWLYTHPAERDEMGRRAREMMVLEHSWDSRAAATLNVLRQVSKVRS